MISFVNGYLCTSSCDVSKAKRGVDPHPKAGDDPNAANPATKNGLANSNDPAVTFGGSLSGMSAAGSIQPAAAANTQNQAQAVNILV
jgi:hypothetical protein